MPLTSETLVFLDAACLIAAAGSSTGGSAYVLSVGQRGFLRLCSSQGVLIEVQRNIQAKLRPSAMVVFQRLLLDTPVLVIPTAPESLVEHFAKSFLEDSHVVAAAIAANAQYLLTLDRRLIQRIIASNLPVEARTPGDFIQRDLTGHANFASIR
jgi:predicted nucleic acid-binding protein